MIEDNDICPKCKGKKKVDCDACETTEMECVCTEASLTLLNKAPDCTICGNRGYNCTKCNNTEKATCSYCHGAGVI